MYILRLISNVAERERFVKHLTPLFVRYRHSRENGNLEFHYKALYMVIYYYRQGDYILER